ncbi:hypothetical protein PIB30_108759, partial [Stylosanthes scabra]|nr:hypothetical protein [Stylosanthes scabra]
LLLDPLILVGSILHLIVVYYLVRFGILAEIVGLLKIRIRDSSNAPSFLQEEILCSFDVANLYDSQQSDKYIGSSSTNKEWVIVLMRKGALSNTSNYSSLIRSNRLTKN